MPGWSTTVGAAWVVGASCVVGASEMEPAPESGTVCGVGSAVTGAGTAVPVPLAGSDPVAPRTSPAASTLVNGAMPARSTVPGTPVGGATPPSRLAQPAAALPADDAAMVAPPRPAPLVNPPSAPCQPGLVHCWLTARFAATLAAGEITAFCMPAVTDRPPQRTMPAPRKFIAGGRNDTGTRGATVLRSSRLPPKPSMPPNAPPTPAVRVRRPSQLSRLPWATWNAWAPMSMISSSPIS